MTSPHSTTSPDDSTRKIDLSLTQVAAAALAAVTAAVVGSTLGAAGTLIGAAGASVITTVGTAVYRASLERSRQRARALAQRTRLLPASREGSRTERAQSAANVPLGDERLTEDDRFTAGTDHASQSPDRSGRFAMLRWGAVVGALGGFLLAMLVITGFELASGETLSGNSEGTTIGRMVNAPPGPRSPAVSPAPPSGSTSVTPTETTTTSTPATTSTTPDGGVSGKQSPSNTSETPTSSEPLLPLIPTRLPGPGD